MPTVQIRIPAESRYVQLTRVAAASMVTDLDPDVDEVEDLRVAVNELVGLLVEVAGRDGEVHVDLAVNGDTISVTGSVTAASVGATPDELTRRILDATVDRYDIGDRTFEMRKRFGRDGS